MQPFLAIQQGGLALHVVGIGHAAIYRTNGGALGFFMKSGAFGAFVRHNEVHLIADGRKFLMHVHFPAIGHPETALNLGTVGNGPFNTCLIDGVIGAFGLAGSAVDTFVGDDDGHKIIRCKINTLAYFRG